MTLGRATWPFLTGLALVLAIALGGCGGSDEEASGAGDGEAAAGASPEYVALLNGLQRAASSGSETYNAVERAKALPPAEKAVADAFCYFAWQIGVNEEASKLKKGEYIVGRIMTSANVNFDSPRAIETAMDELQKVIDLESLKADQVARYSKACEN